MGEGRGERTGLLVQLVNLPEHPESVPIILLAPAAGTPAAEAEQISHFKSVRTIAVTRLLMPRSFVRLSARRTLTGERTVNLLQPALQALKGQKEHTFLNGDEVFQNPRTRMRWTGDMALRARQWKTLCRRAGIRFRPPGQMRHTFASMALMAGESPQWVASQMGHTDWTFTARVYYRWIPHDAGDAGDKLLEKWGTLATSNT